MKSGPQGSFGEQLNVLREAAGRDALVGSARPPARHRAVDELGGISLPLDEGIV